MNFWYNNYQKLKRLTNMLKNSKKVILSFVAMIAISGTAIAQENKVYATVNGMNITQKDVSALLRGQRVKFQSLQKGQQKQILDTLIEQKLLSDMAYKTDIPKTKEYKNELKKVKKALAYQFWLRDFSKKITIANKDVKNYYDNHKAKFKIPEQLKASHILVKTQKEAKKIIATLLKSKNLKDDFTAMAKQKSKGPSGANGGELGWFTKAKMVPAFSAAAEKLAVGTITKTPVKTKYGFHIIYLDDKKAAATLAFDKIKNRLKQDLMRQNFAEKIKAKAEILKKKAKIEYK